MKTYIVTGGAQGIGSVIADSLLERGFRVAVFEIDPEALKEYADKAINRHELLPLLCDVSSEGDVETAISAVMEKWGRIDGVINNAVISAGKPIGSLSLPEWNRVLAVNLTSIFLLAKHAERQLRESKGAIVNICSTRALMSEPNTEAYSASKGGVLSLTHALAVCVKATFVLSGKHMCFFLS